MDCDLWAGRQVSFPIDRTSLPAAIEYAKTNAFSLLEGERLVAFGQLIRREEGRGHLARIIVEPSARGHGYGEALVRSLLDKARGGPYERVSLNVYASNVSAVSLYRKLGFTDAARSTDDAELPGVRYMERPLEDRRSRNGIMADGT